jgi:hypothetical protein
MRKFKLELHDLRIDSFTTTPMAREKGTVFGQQCITCPDTCAYTCGSCYGTCDLSCGGGPTCDPTCGPNATAPNTPCAEC